MKIVGKTTGDDNKMKTIYRKEEGVSPVIATILMVAITVVLAATVYIMVAGMGGSSATTLSANLIKESCDTSTGWANFSLSMNTPESATTSVITVTLDGTSLTYIATIAADNQWTYMDLDGSTTITNGDTIRIRDANLASGSIIAFSVTDYSGNAKYTVP